MPPTSKTPGIISSTNLGDLALILSNKSCTSCLPNNSDAKFFITSDRCAEITVTGSIIISPEISALLFSNSSTHLPGTL